MDKKLKILILEDDPNDRDLLVYQLNKSGIKYVAELVDNGPDFENALVNFAPDLILADYSLPTFHGSEALEAAKKHIPDSPFMVVSGTIGEERSVELIKNGVTDYVLKDKLYTLMPKINRALQEARERDEKHKVEANLKEVFDNTSDYIYSVDKEMRLISCNRAFSENFLNRFGFQPAVGSYFLDSLPAELQAKSLQMFNRALQGESFVSEEEIYFDGNSYWYATKYNPVIRNGQVTGVVFFTSEITNRKQAEILRQKNFEELRLASEKQSAILDTLPANIALLDKQGVIVEVNDAWKKFVYENGLQAPNAGQGQLYSNISQQATGANIFTDRLMAQGIREVIEGRKQKYSLEYASGPPLNGRWYKAEVRPLEGHEKLGAVVMHLDVTDRARAEEEINNLNRDLEHKIAERTADLERANKEMEAFTYTVSHDLRSPLQVINGYSSILEKNYKDNLCDDAKSLLSGIKDNTRHMSQLINDLLSFSHLGRAAIIKKPLQMNELVDVVVNEMKQRDSNFKTTVNVLHLKSASADASLLHQVWVNLISNAIKYSGKHPNPLVEIGMEETADENIYYVKDNGVGFDMQQYDRLFGVFQRLHKPSEFEGTGVGLALVHSVITKHGGRVWAISRLNEGATFYFSLPHTISVASKLNGAAVRQ